MTGLVIICLVVAVAAVLLGLADQRRMYRRAVAWRYRNPEAHEPSDAVLVLQRVGYFVVAVIMVVVGVNLWHTSNETDDRNSWSNDELRTAVTKAAGDLGRTVVADGTDTADDHSSDIEQAVGAAGGDHAPASDVHVERAATGGDRYEVTADGTDAVFCMTVHRTPDVPGYVPGTEDSGVEQYALKGRVRSGGC